MNETLKFFIQILTILAMTSGILLQNNMVRVDLESRIINLQVQMDVCAKKLDEHLRAEQ